MPCGWPTVPNRCLCWAQSVDPYFVQEFMDHAEICGSSGTIHEFLLMIQYSWRRHIYMDRLVIFAHLKFYYFTHYIGPLQSTEQNHRPSAPIAQGGCLRNLPVLCNDLTLISLLWTNIAGQVALYDQYQSGAKRTCLIIVILRQLQAVTPCSIGPNYSDADGLWFCFVL